MKVSELKKEIERGAFREILPLITYDTPAYEKRLLALANDFLERFGDKEGAKFFSAPGRIPLMGMHTDHQGGHACTASVMNDMLSLSAPTGGDEIKLFDPFFGELKVSLLDTEPKPEEKGSALSLLRGMAYEFINIGKVGAFSAVMNSTVPTGVGLSSSAAFEMLIGAMFNEFYCEGGVSEGELAFLGMDAEHRHFGKPCGLMDELAVAVGGVLFIDFKEENAPKIEKINANFEKSGHDIFLILSGGEHSSLTADYTMITDEMAAVAYELGGNVLSECSPLEFFATAPLIRDKYGERPTLRALHFFEEEERVIEAKKALVEKNYARFFDIMNESRESCEKNLQNVLSPREPNMLLKKALDETEKALHGKGAFNINGGGFAGGVLSFLPHDMAGDFCKEIEGAGLSLLPLELRPVGVISFGGES